MNEKTKKINKIILLSLFFIYWILFILEIIMDKNLSGSNKTVYIIMQLVIFMPLTLAIAFQKDVFAIFILLIYEIAMVISGFYIALIYAIKFDQEILLTLINSVITVLLNIFLIISLIKMLRNKENKNKLILLILTFCSLIINIIIYTTSESTEIIKFLMQVDLIIYIPLYIILFIKKEIHVFAQNQ